MAKIKPIKFPFKKDATEINIEVVPYALGRSITTSFIWYITTEDGDQLTGGTYALTPEQFEKWGTDDSYIIKLVVDSLEGVELV